MPLREMIGARVRIFRERLNLSPEELARNAGLDVKLLNQIEEGTIYPPIGLMVRLARALGQRLGTFLDDQPAADPLIVRASDRREETAAHQGGAPGHYHYYSLGKGKNDRHMEPLFIVIDPDDGEKKLSSHEGEELVIVISGEIELAYGRETFRLSIGDSMYYNSIVPHHLGTVGGSPAEIYAVIYMPY